jgi:hypothetical protein
MFGRKIPYLFLLVSVTLSLLTTSCYVEKRLGKAFRETWIDTTALVLAPDYIFKENLKTYEIPQLDSLAEWEKDSLLMKNSLFLNELDDSVLIAKLMNAFNGRLQKHGFTVLKQSSIDQFLTEHEHGLVINFAQVSVEEFVHPYTFDYDLFGETFTISDIDLNAVSVNVWIELSRLNSQQKNKVFFSSDFITDELDGYFRQFIFSGEMKFEYTIDTLSSSMIGEFMELMGRKYADNLYDYFLNDYIRENLPVNYSQNIRRIHWDPVKGLFEYRDNEQGFIELDMDNDP